MVQRRRAQQRGTPTLQQVARVAGVSIATASRVVTGAVPVSPDKRARVEQAIALLGYVPDERARDLRRNHQRTIGYVVPTLSRPPYGEVFREVHRALQGVGFTVLVIETEDEPASIRSAIEVLVRSHARAVVIAAARGLEPEVAGLLRRRDIRVIHFDDRPPDPAATCVAIDDRAGAAALTRHLLRLGHRRIGFVAGALDGSSGVDRHAGYLDALATAAIDADPAIVRGFGWTLETGTRAVRELIALPVRPTAVLAASPVLAAGALVALREGGLAIPDEMSLAAMFESDHIRYVDPPLTCLGGVPDGIAASIVETVATGREGRVDVPVAVLERASTAAPAIVADRTA